MYVCIGYCILLHSHLWSTVSTDMFFSDAKIGEGTKKFCWEHGIPTKAIPGHSDDGYELSLFMTYPLVN